jgi:hypothetical protein
VGSGEGNVVEAFGGFDQLPWRCLGVSEHHLVTAVSEGSMTRLERDTSGVVMLVALPATTLVEFGGYCQVLCVDALRHPIRVSHGYL